jgi:hypothetical protein
MSIQNLCTTMARHSLCRAYLRDGSAVRLADPAAEVGAMARDALEAKMEICAVLDRLADKHGVPARDLNEAVAGHVDTMLGDLLFAVERTLDRSVARADPSDAD